MLKIISDLISESDQAAGCVNSKSDEPRPRSMHEDAERKAQSYEEW